MKMNALIFKSVILFCLLSTPITTRAETVSVNDGQGHGFMFRHGGQCYAILPHHVHASDAPFSVSAPDRAEPGLGFVQFRRPGADLAVAEVTGSVTKYCTVPWSDLVAAAARTPGLGPVDVVRINRQGAAQSLPLKLDGMPWEALRAQDGQAGGHHRYLSLSAPDGVAIHPGTSGAFVFRDAVPLGMVLNAIPPNKARALALEEITGPVGRWLQSRTVHISDKKADATAGEGVPFEVVGFGAAATDPSHSAVSLQGGGTYRYSGRNTENVVEIGFPAGTTSIGSLVVGRLVPAPQIGITTPTRLTVRTKVGDRFSPYTSKPLPANGGVVEISVPVRTTGLLLELSGAYGAVDQIEFGPLVILPHK